MPNDFLHRKKLFRALLPAEAKRFSLLYRNFTDSSQIFMKRYMLPLSWKLTMLIPTRELIRSQLLVYDVTDPDPAGTTIAARLGSYDSRHLSEVNVISLLLPFGIWQA